MSIPIWIRVMKLPCGMMNRCTGKAIGDEVGTFLEMDMDENCTAVGRFLRIKIRLDIRKPLMRGVTVMIGKEEKALWCPLEYEFLPDFCYSCGIIGHTNKICEKEVMKGELPPFNKQLRCIPSKKRSDDGYGDRGIGGRLQLGWRAGSGGSRESFGGSGSRSGSGKPGSDAPSWRKSDHKIGGGWKSAKVGEEEVTSSIKVVEKLAVRPNVGRALVLEKEVHDLVLEDLVVNAPKVSSGQTNDGGKEDGSSIVTEHSVMQSMQNDVGGVGGSLGKKEEVFGESKTGGRAKYKRRSRGEGQAVARASVVTLERKRQIEDAVMEDGDSKKAKIGAPDCDAGLSEQPCETQCELWRGIARGWGTARQFEAF